ncbi:unnamed protein product [Candida verbasci]|uniref:Vps72/YL1 C-terminal domain-containing protein n=1 Tax=Candida verbasci TaxID=1227364 RepID=A0A9W4TYD4_9ASCO|nr:unnamed protein product [Candida verbasci]
MSDDDLDELDEFESLMATRHRRSNAGSRLKKLLELERESKNNQQFITEDDENVNLLFQEDGEDEEFIDEEEEELLEEEPEEEEEQSETERKEEESESEVAQVVNSDEQLSDSDISASDLDDSEGEKELQKQERIKKRKKKTVIPAIKKLKSLPPKPKKSHLITSDALLLSNRRSSARSSAMESKQALIDKLKESELRKAKYSHRFKRKKQVELTQGERLAQAIETERMNVESLNKFREQEFIKKEKQKSILQSKRKKLVNVIRLISKETFVNPIEEVTFARRQWEYYMKMRKRLSKKKLTQLEEENEWFTTKLPFSIDYDQPYQQNLIAERKRKEEISKLENMNAELKEKLAELENVDEKIVEDAPVDHVSDDKQATEKKFNEKESLEKELLKEVDEKPVEKEEIVEEEAEKKVDEEEGDKKVDETLVENEKIVENEVEKEVVDDEGDKADIVKEKVDEKKEDDKEESIKDENEEKQENTNKEKDLTVEDSKNVDVETKDVKIDNEGDVQMEEVSPNDTNIENKKEAEKEKQDVDEKHDVEVKQEINNSKVQEIKNEQETERATTKIKAEDQNNKESTPQEKRVTFADETTPEQPLSTPTLTPTPTQSNSNEEIFEGPPQRISRNTIYFLNFDEDQKLTPSSIKSSLFGKQSILPASRRFKDLKTIIHIGNNPYTQKNKPDTFLPISEITDDSSMFDDLKKLPRLGVKVEEVEQIEDQTQDESAEIVLKTDAPTGLYLPNGNKKNCMISGTEVKYFDPATGIPYSSVEVYKFLKSIESGLIPWYCFDLESNDTGVAEVYLGNRDGVRHAKDVPHGFDG